MKVLSVGMMVCDTVLTPVSQSIFQMEKAEIEEPVVTTGGDALNVAVTLAALGMPVSIAGRLGNDKAGMTVLELIEEKGIDTRYIVWDESCKTSVSYLLLDENGEKHSLSNTRICHRLCAGDVPDQAIEEADIVFFGSALQMRQMDHGGAACLFKRAHLMGKTTAMDTAISDDLDSWENAFARLKPVLKETDIFLPSYIEASNLTGLKEPEQIAACFKESGVKVCGIKLGSKGCYITDFTQEYHLPCFTDFKAVDTTGAGDSFVGGFLWAYLKKWDLKECAEFASAVAAHNVAAKGATGGVPGAQTIIDFLNSKQNRKKE